MITNYVVFLFLVERLGEQRKISDENLSSSGFFAFEGVLAMVLLMIMIK
eukprot:CAMPEP_0194383704 /NCGR_PEP_ID=MMETSP0174-20130528/69151_1 /TAXON_ID=216777 /ORGANISM="Proboscia alata, Strain PI-D3" /LENGTH=48 /DNA_ID= /DNA_START= /DNA_END= /DNA_ORIENTATION=